jgi:hypothetical protein
MILYSYNGIRFASIGLSGGLTTEQETGPENTSNDLARSGFQPLHIGVTQGVKTLPVSFIVDPLHDLEQTRHLLLATFDPKDTTERPLVALKADGVPVVAYAALVRYDWDHPTGIILTFVFTDPVWRKLAPSTFGPLAVNYANEAILPVENRGMARENLIVTIKPTGHNDVSHRRQFSVPAQFHGYEQRRLAADPLSVRNRARRYHGLGRRHVRRLSAQTHADAGRLNQAVHTDQLSGHGVLSLVSDRPTRPRRYRHL